MVKEATNNSTSELCTESGLDDSFAEQRSSVFRGPKLNLYGWNAKFEEHLTKRARTVMSMDAGAQERQLEYKRQLHLLELQQKVQRKLVLEHGLKTSEEAHIGHSRFASCHGDVGGYFDQADMHRRLVHLHENQEFLKYKKAKLIETLADQDKLLEQRKFCSFKPKKLRQVLIKADR